MTPATWLDPVTRPTRPGGVRAGSNAEAVVMLAQRRGEVTRQEVSMALGISKKYAAVILSDLRARGTLKACVGGKGGVYKPA